MLSRLMSVYAPCSHLQSLYSAINFSKMVNSISNLCYTKIKIAKRYFVVLLDTQKKKAP